MSELLQTELALLSHLAAHTARRGRIEILKRSTFKMKTAAKQRKQHQITRFIVSDRSGVALSQELEDKTSQSFSSCLPACLTQ